MSAGPEKPSFTSRTLPCASITYEVGIFGAPLLGSHAENGLVEHIGFFAERHQARRSGVAFNDRQDVFADGFLVQVIVDFGKGTAQVPFGVFEGFETLEFFDDVEVKNRTEPGAEGAARRHRQHDRTR